MASHKSVGHSPPSSTSQTGRVMITKIGFDGHDRGSRIVASYLRDAGMEVIYTPPWQTIESVVRIAMQEDIDVIGVSSLATDHLILPELTTALEHAGLSSVQVIAGGIIPVQERPRLMARGIKAFFGPGSAKEEIVGCARALCNRAHELKRAPGERGVNDEC